MSDTGVATTGGIRVVHYIGPGTFALNAETITQEHADLLKNAVLEGDARLVAAGRTAFAALQEGVVGSGDLLVTQRGAGANLSVDVAGGVVLVQDDSDALGLLAYITKSGTTNVTVTAANGTNPRLDQVVIDKTGAISVVAGTATSGATMANRTGAASLPASSVRLGDILVPAAASTVSNSNIRDRRPWARGAFARGIRQTDLSLGNTIAALDTNNFQFRIECSGAPVRLRFIAALFGPASITHDLRFWQDGTAISTNAGASANLPASFTGLPLDLEYVFAPAAGSHLFTMAGAASAGSSSGFTAAKGDMLFTVEEIVRANAFNGTV